MNSNNQLSARTAADLLGISSQSNLRTFVARDDRLASKFRMGDIVVVDVTDLSLREGYVLVGCDETAQPYRISPDFEGGYRLMCDDHRYGSLTVSREMLQDQILGRIVGAVCRV